MGLINRCCADPAVLFSPAEMMVELQRWCVTVPTRKPDEPEPLYAHRLRLVGDVILSRWRFDKLSTAPMLLHCNCSIFSGSEVLQIKL